ncbi:hypothetical protein ACT17_05870 [Mycolicibacterium conceptionense]|jgi:hypothetical protein|uniref:Uncharacterized protein n=2 Tax=Mycolicibacterium TaxID=1866885 RepID=A0ABR5FQL8_9MYCO|nr:MULTISPECIES: hypothetical protein [Mycolicibacterium]KLI07144.1 hypothetical protein AA982_16680 [Mycolicibacterium senegalense]KLO50174.1 hypothetical protein ABW05_00190 [Mycolicibacterium senegalense]KMV19578.1 hypothetical protein ACT17_05870 [Mycolicibacterium conceptionense]OBK03757.1 hypothetical protein A5639_21880 [Mycolicibacterium conceptionense]OMB81870.1 hypothetical protein A5741_24605 [Mycolicibacterium conceptionense]
MADINIKRAFREGMFRIRVNDGDEFEVNPRSWNDPEQRASIIAAELGVEPRPWMGDLDDVRPDEHDPS